MSVIQQIYCTHCTHGSSALERREGELAHRMLGYSARAGSLEAQELRKCYRQIERYAYYYLPRDTPGEEKLRLIAASAPRRLIFFPSTSGLQVAGQVCYRQTDTEGRPGSYFAHVLFQDEQDGLGRWSPADCLKLWNARGWVDEDSTTIPFVLRSLYSLSEMYQNVRPAIDDGVLRSYLTTPAGGNFDDPAGVIPQRYRVAPPKQRINLLTDVFRGLLEIDLRQRESLLIVVEPSLAALLFYGIVRLLPAGPFRDGISFSTYEPNTERLGTTLAATIFHDPLRTDLRPDAYRSRGFAVNTFLDRRTDFRQPQAAYAVTVLQRLLGEGWDAVDRMLMNLEAVGAKTAEDLDALAAVDRIVPALFDPRQPLPGDGWRRSPMAIRYLRRILGRRLAELADPRALESLVGRPQHLLVLELIAAEPDASGTRAAAEYLLRQLPGERIGDLLRLEEISSEAKVDVLVRHVTAQGALPPGCDQLWQSPGATAGSSSSAEATVGQANAGVAAGANTRSSTVSPGGHAGPDCANRGDDLLPRLLARLDVRTLVKFYGNVAAKHSDVFVLALLSSCRDGGRTGSPVGRIGNPSGLGADLADGLPIRPTEDLLPRLTEIVGVMSEESLVSLYRSHGPEFFKDYPADEPALGRKLHELIQSLPQHLGQFRDRLDLITSAARLLPEDDDQTAATAWSTCRAAILDIGRLQDQRGGMFRQPPIDQIEAAARRMSEAVVRALPRDRFEDDRTGGNKRKCLERLGAHLLAGKPLLPRDRWQFAAIWQKVAWHFERGVWPSAPLWKLRPKSKLPVPPWVIFSTLAVLALLVVALVMVNRPPAPQEAAVSGKEDTTAEQASSGAQAERLKQDKAEQERQKREADEAQKKAAEEKQRREREADKTRLAAKVSVSPDGDAGATGATAGLPNGASGNVAGQASSGTEASGGHAGAGSSKIGSGAAGQVSSDARAEQEKPSEPAAPLREADLWKAKAEQYAREHQGQFIQGLLLTEGKAEIPLEDLPPAPAGTTWYLGNGRIYLRNGTHPFGEGFENSPPENRRDVPSLAADLQLKSVFVQLHQGGDVLRLEVGGVPADPPGGSDADKKARMEELGRRINMLTSKLGTYRRTNTPAGKRDEAFQAIIELAQIKFSPVPLSPDPGNPKYHSRPSDRPDVFNRHLFDADLNAHNDAKARNDATRAAVPETAAQRLREYQQQFDSLKYESRPATSQVRRENDPSLAALRKGCRSISVLIYQPMRPEGTPPVSPDGHAGDGSPGGDLPTAEQTGAGTDRVDPAGVAAGADTSDLDLAAAGNVPAIDGVFDVKKRPMTGLRATDTKVKFTVTAQGGLPSRLRQSAVIDSLLIEKNEERKGRAHETPVYVNNKEKVEPMTTVVQQDAVSFSTTIRFFRRSGDPFQPRGKLVAVSAVHSIEPVEEKSEYTVRFEISAAGLDKLMRLLDGH